MVEQKSRIAEVF